MDATPHQQGNTKVTLIGSWWEHGTNNAILRLH